MKYTPTKESIPEWRAAWAPHRDDFEGSKARFDAQSAYHWWVSAIEEVAAVPEGESGTRCERWQLPKIVRRRQRKPEGPRGKLHRLREQLVQLRSRPIDKRLIGKATGLLEHFKKRGAEWASEDRLHDEGLLRDVEVAWKEERETAKVRNLQAWHARMDDDDELLRWVRDTAEERPAAKGKPLHEQARLNRTADQWNAIWQQLPAAKHERVRAMIFAEMKESIEYVPMTARQLRKQFRKKRKKASGTDELSLSRWKRSSPWPRS